MCGGGYVCEWEMRRSVLRVRISTHNIQAAAGAAKGGKGKQAKPKGVPRKPLEEGDECGVCFELLVEVEGGARSEAEAMSYCTTCGNSLHTQWCVGTLVCMCMCI